MRDNPGRLAWIVLLTSFFICMGLVVIVPLGVRHYVLYARIPQNTTLEVQQGPLRVTLAGRGAPVAIDETRENIPERTIVATDVTAGRLAMRVPQVDDAVIATVQLYNHTEAVLSSARSPRFSISQLPHKVVLEVRAGRVRINVFDGTDRPTTVEAQTPHGTVTLAAGSYEVKVNGTTMEITVRDGRADVTSGTEQAVSLDPAERAIIDASEEQIVGPLPAARNIIHNGDFQAPLESENRWSSYSQQTDPQQPLGVTRIITDTGQNAIEFYRDGSNHAEVGIQQEINYDVRDFAFLQLHLDVRIVGQDISGFGGCGYLGTECPIIVRLEYKDIYGTDREWLHGFYTGEPAGDWLINWWAERLQSENWQTFDSDNLMEELAGTPPALIKSLTIYASGHSFHAMATEVELLVQE
ncbi:MAG: hypothetical protein V3S14_05835 [Anaerolineae bacterium]